MELTAVDIVVVTPKHGNQLAGVEGIHGDGASAGHKHKLRDAAMRHCELKSFTTLIADLPIIYLREKQ